MADVAIYVQRKYAKQTYAQESYNVRAWPGIEMVRDELTRSGIPVDYCAAGNVRDYKLILHSITSACDWWSFIAERKRWPKGDYKVMIGGAGVLNVRPFLSYADWFFLGRADGIIVQIVSSILTGETPDVDYLIDSHQFSIDARYDIRQAEKCYPHETHLANGKIFRESAIGCQRRCLFCNYTFTRKHIGGLQGESGALAADREKTLFELNLDAPETWFSTGLAIVGLDGLSERIRRMVNKPISDQMLRKFFSGLGQISAKSLKMYTIVGLPTENNEEWDEFVAALADSDNTSRAPKTGIKLNCSHFRAMPATPSAPWPMSYRNYRGEIARSLRRMGYAKQRNELSVFYDGKGMWAIETMGTDSLVSAILDAMVLRGTEADADIVAKIATTPKFWAGNCAAKIASLEKHIDVSRFFGEYTWETLPTRYLRTYISNDELKKMGNTFRRWPRTLGAL